jgi:mRNA interferase RelE/StbE
LVWTIDYGPRARRQLQRLDRQVAQRVDEFLKQRVARLDDPRLLGRALRGPLNNRWRYRVGDYRIICDIQDRRVVILVIEIDHRSRIYR